MSPQRWERVQDLVLEALDLHEDDCRAFLDKECADDAELRESVESLLKVRDADKSFLLDKPAVRQDDGTGSRFKPPAALSEFSPAERISHFEIEDVLGRGGMGVVYKARDVDLDRPVALKFISPLLSVDDEARRRLLIEAKTTSALDHPNICTIYEIGWADIGDESHAYIAMAYYEGETLNQVIERGPLEPETAVDYALQIAQGLEAAHEAGIVHRDIKPSNILVTSKNVVKILDFGIARSTATDVTKTQGPSGTLHYMSPEQVQGNVADAQTDVWALGVVFHEMLTGRKPFTGEYEASVIYAILNETPGVPSSTNPEIPTGLDEVVSRAIDKDTARRHQDMAELLSDLEAVAAGQDPAPAPSSAWRAVVHGKRLVGVSLAGILIATIFTAGALFSGFFAGGDGLASRLRSGSSIEKTGTRQDKLIAVLPFQFVGSEENSTLAEGIYYTLALALNGADVVESVDYNAIFGLLGSTEAVRNTDVGIEVASYFGAGRFMLGNVIEHGDRFRVTGIMYDHEGNMLHTVSGGDIEGSEFVHAVDSMALEIISSEAGNEHQGLLSAGLQMTRSVEALKAFVEAERLRRNHFVDNAAEIDEHYARAAKLDTNFALPVIRRVGHLPWGGESRKQRLAAATRFTPRLHLLPARERQEAQAKFAVDSVDHFGRLARFKALADRWPDYAWAWYYYADTIFHNGFFFGQPAEESQQAAERALFLDPGHSELAYHLVDFAARERDFDLVDSLEKSHGGLRFGWSTDLVVSLGRDDEEGVRAAVEGVDSVSALQVHYAVWRCEFYGLYDEAREMLELLKEKADAGDPGESELWIPWHEAFLDLMQGRVNRSDSTYATLVDDAALGLPNMVLQAVHPFQPVDTERVERLRDVVASWDTSTSRIEWMGQPTRGHIERGRYAELKLFLEGALAFRAGDSLAFQASVRKLHDLASSQTDPGSAFTLEKTLTAIQLREAGKLDDALQALAEARIPETFHFVSPVRSQGFHRFLTAEILFEQGRYDEALRWYRSVNETGWVSGIGMGQFLGPVWYRRARIYDEQGEDEMALEYYQRFIDVWNEADPELQHWVEDARARREAVLEKQVREPT